MKKRTLILAAVFSFLIIGCSNNSDPSASDLKKPTDPAKIEAAEKKADETWNDLNKMVQKLEEPKNVDSGDDLFSKYDYEKIKKGFEDSLKEDETNPTARLGTALAELVSINYDDDLWQIINDSKVIDGVATSNSRSNQFAMLSKSFTTYPNYISKITNSSSNISKRSSNGKDFSNISFAKLQNYIEDKVMDKIKNATFNLDAAIMYVEDNGFIEITVSDEEDDTVRIDKGELLVFRASVNALSASMQVFTLYDVDLFGTDGTYKWLDDLKETNHQYTTTCKDEGNTFHHEGIDRDDNDIANKKLIFNALKHNLENRNDFLIQRHSSKDIKDSLEKTLEDLEAAVKYIESRKNPSDNVLIKLSSIKEMNKEIKDSDKADFAKNWTNVHDVIAWLKKLLNEPFTTKINNVDVTIDVQKLFDPGVKDLKEMLPYFQWKDESEWETKETSYSYSSVLDGEMTIYCNDVETTVNSGTNYSKRYSEYEVIPVELTKPDGAALSKNEKPHFPDYTFGGLLKGMNRATFLKITKEED